MVTTLQDIIKAKQSQIKINALKTNPLKSKKTTKVSIKLGNPVELVSKAITFVNPINLIGTASTMLIGSREEKAKKAFAVLPATVKTKMIVDVPAAIKARSGTKFQKVREAVFKKYTSKITTQPIEDKIKETINQWKSEDPKQKEFWEEKTFLNTEIKVPDLPKIPDIFSGLKDIGKYALIGGVILIAILLLGRNK